MAIDYKKLSDTLLESGLLTEDQLSVAQQRSAEHSVSVEEELVSGEYVTDEHLGQIIADLYDVPFVNLKKKSIDEKVLKMVPELVARRQLVIAYNEDPDNVQLAMHDPHNAELMHFLEKKMGKKVIPHFATERDITNSLQYYKRGLKDEFDAIIQENLTASKGSDGAEEELPITKIIDTILNYAYQQKASDVHIEPHDEVVVIRFRIDGILHDMVQLPKDIHDNIITRIKILSRLRTDEHRAAQDGRLEFKVDKEQVDVRVSVIPISDGEKVVLRLLSEKSRQFKLQELGLTGEDLVRLERNIRKPYGMILATGPTGSGKTTTLYAILKLLNSREVNISTIEDPVEYDVEGVNQIQVDTKTNLHFSTGLRSILRQDPDIVMVGEIRDEETAGIAINSAMTGHLVLSTLHTNDAPTTLPRLLDMKIEPFLIATTINLALAQRLVRQIHQGCMESFMPTDDELDYYRQAIGPERAALMGMDGRGFRLYRGRGCQLCSHTGFEGRIGIFEVLEMNDEIRQLIMKRANSSEIREAAIKNGMSTMLDDGLRKAATGITTLEEVMRATRA